MEAASPFLLGEDMKGTRSLSRDERVFFKAEDEMEENGLFSTQASSS